MKLSLFLLLLILSGDFLAQSGETLKIQGKIIDAVSKEPIPYSKIYNCNNKTGSVSGFDGQFTFQNLKEKDTLKISANGYRDSVFQFHTTINFTEFQLLPKIQVLPEVNASADNSQLYNLLSTCRKHIPENHISSKAFLEIQSFHNSDQVELFQGYYNAFHDGYDLNQLELKSGKYFYLRDPLYRFTSTNVSPVFYLNRLFENNDFFPENPLQLSKRQLKKDYLLSYGGKTKDGNGHTSVRIFFKPRKNNGAYFSGEIVLDSANASIQALTLKVENAIEFPFERIGRLPMNDVRMTINQEFVEFEGRPTLKSVNFFTEYKVKSRLGAVDTIVSHSILHLIDLNAHFEIARFDFPKKDMHEDLRKSLLLSQENWECLSLFGKNIDSAYQSDRFQTLAPLNIGLEDNFGHIDKAEDYFAVESPYILWDKNKRVKLRTRESSQKPTNFNSFASIPTTNYAISAQILLEINYDCDSNIQFTTKTVFDPFETFIHFPMTPQILAFMNIYFDMVELERRKLEIEIAESNKTIESIDQLYLKKKIELEKNMREYCRKVQLGKELIELKKYNEMVRLSLGIDNLELFNINVE